jgi:hypothetical protein
MELEAAYAVFGDQASGASDRGLSGVRVDGAEGDEDVGVCGGLVGDLLAGQGRVAGRSGGVDGEHDCRHVAGAVVVGDVREGGRAVCGGLEVGRGGVHEFVVE